MVFSPESGDPFISVSPREFYVSHFVEQILVCVYTSMFKLVHFQEDQISDPVTPTTIIIDNTSDHLNFCVKYSWEVVILKFSCSYRFLQWSKPVLKNLSREITHNLYYWVNSLENLTALIKLCCIWFFGYCNCLGRQTKNCEFDSHWVLQYIFLYILIWLSFVSTNFFYMHEVLFIRFLFHPIN